MVDAFVADARDSFEIERLDGRLRQRDDGFWFLFVFIGSGSAERDSKDKRYGGFHGLSMIRQPLAVDKMCILKLSQ